MEENPTAALTKNCAVLIIVVLCLAACKQDGGSDCPVGSRGCACTSGGGCDPGLECQTGTCVAQTPDSSIDTLHDEGSDVPGLDTPVQCTSDGDCDDGDPCTTDTCDDMGDCQHATLDGDGDGFAAMHVSGTDCGGTDCDDGRSDVYPDAPESSCHDGFDQDCNGITGPEKLVEEVSFDPDDLLDTNAIAWSGSRFGVVWKTETRIDFGLLHADGTTAGSSSTLASELVYIPEISWSGSTWAVFWMDGTESQVQASVLDPDGAVLASAIPLASMNSAPQDWYTVTWGGSQFGIASLCTDSCGDGVYLTRMDGEGTVISTEPDLVATAGMEALILGLTWTGSEFGIMLMNPEATLVRVSPDGTTLDSLSIPGISVECLDITVCPGDILAWTGSEFGMAFHEDNDPMFARISATGTQIGSTIRISDPDLPPTYRATLDWSGTGFGILWHHDGTNLYFSHVDPSATSITEALAVDDVTTMFRHADILWTGSEFAVAWIDFDASPRPQKIATVGWCD